MKHMYTKYNYNLHSTITRTKGIYYLVLVKVKNYLNIEKVDKYDIALVNVHVC